ncbi:hypothetical protein PTTG_11987 [Puccinia triticina 1-1 BBBD Race 1]|uniref:Uncharacterized protein n=1 Tax=Puccinia triticina (isolate 1-1 / race 1 (BBBD)) TaxID=630390 RepID=A0A180GVV5_PUCT1|nr:hypothetical protein PTTG_11987 [Puccinia triticina 1-1 BBBD Race 1]
MNSARIKGQRTLAIRRPFPFPFRAILDIHKLCKILNHTMQLLTLITLLTVFSIVSHVDCRTTKMPKTFNCPLPSDVANPDPLIQARVVGYCSRPVTDNDLNANDGLERDRLRTTKFFVVQAINFPNSPGVFSCVGKSTGAYVQALTTTMTCGARDVMLTTDKIKELNKGTYGSLLTEIKTR